MNTLVDNSKTTVILGGGLTGLSAGYALSKAGYSVKVFESSYAVGGLSKTIVHKGFRFDLGGHRFFTKDERIVNFVRGLMDGELISVPRKSKIYMQSKFFEYPLRPLNAMFGLGIPTTFKIISDYGLEKIRSLVTKEVRISLEDWVVSNFGRKMFDIYFKEYSEKVWGIECSRISADWVAQRIKGLSLGEAIKNTFFRFNGKDIPSLADRFLYPRLGIGRISERLTEEIKRDNDVFTDTSVERINHSDYKIDSIVVKNHKYSSAVCGKKFISSMPLPNLIKILNPAPPADITDAASRLRFRALIVIAIMVNRERVTDQSWIYIPEKKIPFGRIHEPKNWSEKMAPKGKTLIVTEFFSSIGDNIWTKDDEELTDIAIKNLELLRFIKKQDVMDSVAIRAPKAYPLFEVGYDKDCSEIYDYLSKFKNLYIAGRSGMFRYYNMDHAIESGLDTAEKIIRDRM